MAEIFVYAPDCENFDNIGEAGSLTPTECSFFGDQKRDVRIGAFPPPLTRWGKWTYLKKGYILKAAVPVRTIPEIGEDGTIVTSIEKWVVRPSATKAQRRLYTRKSGGKLLKTLKTGTEVFVTKKGENRYKCKTGRYSGWIATAGIEYSLTQDD